MDTTKSILRLALLLTTIATLTNALEVRVLTGLNMRGQANQPDSGDQKLVLNSNNRYVYPSQQVPEYNIFSLPSLYYNRNFLEVVSNNFVYPILLIDQRTNQAPSYQLVHPYTRQIMEQVSEPIYLKPMERLQYVVEDQAFNIMSFVFSGTGLFVVGGVFLYFCYKTVMPKLEEAQMAPEATQ